MNAGPPAGPAAHRAAQPAQRADRPALHPRDRRPDQRRGPHGRRRRGRGARGRSRARIELVVRRVPQGRPAVLRRRRHVRPARRARRRRDAADLPHRSRDGAGHHRRRLRGAGARAGRRGGSPRGRRRGDRRAQTSAPSDFVLGIATSGTTPYVHGALRRARERGARTGFLLCTYPPRSSLKTHDVVIAPLVGPEVDHRARRA